MEPITVWDIPTRLFHWTLVLCFALGWLTSESDALLSLHTFVGYVMLGLIGFRLVWGLVGGRYARFASFAYSPRAALRYAREVLARKAPRHIGHNPAGSLAIYTLLALVAVVGVSGLLTLGGEEQHGVASGWLAFAQGKAAKEWHEGAATLMLLIVLGHVAGVVVESWLHRENLALSMVTGSKLAPRETPESEPHVGVAMVLALVLAGFAVWWFGAALERPQSPPTPTATTASTALASEALPDGGILADNATWREECASCHLAYQPGLLPQRSWQKLMAQQDQHFGTDLGLSTDVAATVLRFLNENAAETHATEAAFKIDQSIAAASVPLRITDTPYWVRKHRTITATQWRQPGINSKAHCEACHADAQVGTFDDAAIEIPAPKPVRRR